MNEEVLDFNLTQDESVQEQGVELGEEEVGVRGVRVSDQSVEGVRFGVDNISGEFVEEMLDGFVCFAEERTKSVL